MLAASVWMILAASVSAMVLATSRKPDSEGDGWERIAPLFDVPAAYKDDYGSYSSVLSFENGRQVRTVADWSKRRAEIWREWMRELGPWPDPIENPEFRILSSEHVESFTRQKLELQIAPGRVTEGYLLIPDGAARMGAVLDVFYKPEEGAGLVPATRQQTDFGYQLARRGFATLCISQDPSGERSPLYYPDFRHARLQPLSYLAYIAANCANFLAKLPQVDAARIGIVGHSYGGKWALFAACLCDRFACVAVSDPGVVFDETRPNINYWEPWYLGYEPGIALGKSGLPSRNKPRTGAYRCLSEKGIDLHLLHALLAPRPLFVAGGPEDPPSRWQALNRLVEVNRLLGYENRVGLAARPEHTILPQTSEQICSFFQHFLGQDRGRTP